MMLSFFETALLGTLLDHERTGLEILEVFALGGEWQIDYGSLYLAVHRLEAWGYVTSRWGDVGPISESPFFKRRYYSATEEGRRILAVIELREEDVVELYAE